MSQADPDLCPPGAHILLGERQTGNKHMPESYKLLKIMCAREENKMGKREYEMRTAILNRVFP